MAGGSLDDRSEDTFRILQSLDSDAVSSKRQVKRLTELLHGRDMPFLDEGGTEFRDQIVCPWCGYEHLDEDLKSYDYGDRWECAACGELMRTEVHVSFSTSKFVADDEDQEVR